MVADAPGRALLRAVVRLLPGPARRAYADEILELNRERRAEVRGAGAVLRFWTREITAALAAVGTAWTDPRSPRRPPARPHRRGVAASLLHDLRHAMREIRRSRAVSTMVVVTLAVGIGAVLTVFSLVDALLLNPIPVPQPERVVRVFQVLGPDSPRDTSYPMLADYRRATSIEGPAGWTTLEAGFRVGDVSDRVSVGMVTGDFFEVLRVRPAAGRLIQPADELPEAPFLVVLSHDLWTRVFHGDPEVVGTTVQVSGTPFTVIGVTPEGFRGASLTSAPELWFPITRVREVADSGLYSYPQVLETRAFSWIAMVGRLPEGVQAARAEAELDRIARAVRAELGEDDPDAGGQQIVRLQPLVEAAVAGADPYRGAAASSGESAPGGMVRFVVLLGGIVASTLLVACLNSALLISTRAWSRDLELSVRQALGATRGDLLRLLLVESVLLALAGAAAGIGLALLAARALRSFALPGGLSLARLDMGLDARMAAVALLLALVSAALFGLWPALVQSRRGVADRLRAAGRGVTGEVPGLPVMISVQAGLSLVLLVGALLFSRTLLSALDTPLGFDPRGVAAVSFAFQGHGYDRDDIPAALDAIVPPLESSPAVSSAALAAHVPLSPAWGRLRPEPEGAPDDWQATPIAINTVTGGYFRTLRIPLVAGRTFGPEDAPGAPHVAVLNRAAAATLFPERQALGGRFVLLRGLEPIEVVGIVADHKAHSVADAGVPYVYLAAAQNAGVGISTGAHLVARATGAPEDALAVMRERLRAFDPALPVYDTRLVESQMNEVLMPQRFGALLLGLLAGVTLIVSAIGVYAMVSFGVRRRTREIGIRMALGAGARRVMGESVVRTGSAVLAGVAMGIALAAGLVRFVEGYLYGIDALDPGSFGGAALVLVVVSMAAALGPALRAARIAPARALGEER